MLGRRVLTVGLAVAAVLLLALAATGERVPMATEGTGGWYLGRRSSPHELEESTAATLPADARDESRLPGGDTLSLLAQTAVITVGLLALVVAGRLLHQRSRWRAELGEAAGAEHWPEPTGELVDAVDTGLAALRDGTVDDAVVACWVGLEDAAACAGVVRDPTETPAELVTRVLAELHAPPAAIDGLLQRYRRARFSHHPLDETDRAFAIRSLAEIRAAIAGAYA